MILRPSHIEDYLVTVRTGQWFGWSDFENKIYANLIVHDGGSKPTESDCTTGLTALQTAWDERNKKYKRTHFYLLFFEKLKKISFLIFWALEVVSRHF